MRRQLGVVLATAVAMVGLGQLPALADDTVTVHGPPSRTSAPPS